MQHEGRRPAGALVLAAFSTLMVILLAVLVLERPGETEGRPVVANSSSSSTPLECPQGDVMTNLRDSLPSDIPAMEHEMVPFTAVSAQLCKLDASGTGSVVMLDGADTVDLAERLNDLSSYAPGACLLVEQPMRGFIVRFMDDQGNSLHVLVDSTPVCQTDSQGNVLGPYAYNGKIERSVDGNLLEWLGARFRQG
jgi:hypothetical protein